MKEWFLLLLHGFIPPGPGQYGVLLPWMEATQLWQYQYCESSNMINGLFTYSMPIKTLYSITATTVTACCFNVKNESKSILNIREEIWGKC